MINCHRCGAEIKAGEVFYCQPIRLYVRAGGVFTCSLKPNPLYHKKCLPPSLFHSGREFPHDWESRGEWANLHTLEYVKRCRACGSRTTLANWLNELSGDNRDACPSTRDLAWQTVPDSSAPLPRQPA
jgi:hypothetical protein